MSTPEIVLAAHLPLVNIGSDRVPFAGGCLWRMPFEAFNDVTAGAFEDHRTAYEVNAPVFYQMVVRPSLPNVVPIPAAQPRGERLQLKMASGDSLVLRQAGLSLLEVFHREAVTPVWLSLVLINPDASLPRPDWSLSFAVTDEGWGFSHNGKVLRIATVQGDADVNYLITEGFEKTPIDTDTAADASAWAERLSARTIDAALWPALDVLGACSSPLLGVGDRAALATAGLEGLLLPEVRSGLARQLARRVAALLGGPAAQRRARESQVRALYEARSAALHGENAREAPADPECGPPLLAAAVRSLDAGCRTAGVPVASLVKQLESADVSMPVAHEPREWRPWQMPLRRSRASHVGLPLTNLASPDGSWLMWAPLPRLHCTEPMTLDGTEANMVLPLTGAEMLTLEEKDIRRDFPAQLYGVGEHLATLCLRLDESEAPREDDAFVKLERRRDVAVTALRLAGFHEFCDPALAGPVLMFNSMRLRRPTVLCAAVWQLSVDESRAVTLRRSADEPRLILQWRRLVAADPALHPDLERALSLYRRGFDRRFASSAACAALHFAALEALLGRFGPAGEPDGLESLVLKLLGPEHAEAQWFSSHGRRARNALAHGGQGAISPELANVLAAVLGAALPRAIDLWLADPSGAGRPAERLARDLLRPAAIDSCRAETP